MLQQLKVMQVVDSLAAGGLEGLAVNLGNALAENGVESHLCATRAEGPLADSVSPSVKRLSLRRQGRLDIAAMRRLVAYNRRNGIQLLHAHGTSVFLSLMASFFSPYPRVIWHVHFGALATHRDRAGLYRFAGRRARAIITVSQPLSDWCRHQLGVAPEKVSLVANFISRPPPDLRDADLPGQPGFRIVCVGNLRPEKDHLTLLRAMKKIVATFPQAHLVLVGAAQDAACHARLCAEIRDSKLSAHVTLLGPRQDVASILKSCDIGVLSSVVEGLPMALLEYGIAGLAAVATRVGQCAEVLDGGGCGMLVSPGSPDQIAAAIIRLLASPEERGRLGTRFRARAERGFTAEATLPQVHQLYESVLAA